MQWGLLAGAGRGLQQGADIVSRGLAEDRNARREDARYQSQIAREDARYEDQKSREDARYATESDRWERTFAQHAEQNKLTNDRADRAETRQTNRDKISDERYGSEKRIGQVNNELGKIFTDYNATASAISQEAAAEIKLLQSQTQLLARAQKSADPLAILQEGGMEGVPPESIGKYINDMNQRVQEINEVKMQRLQELESDRDTLLAGAKAYYGKDVDQSNFAAFLSQQGLGKEKVAEITTLSQTNDAVAIGAQLFGGGDKAKPESSTEQKPESTSVSATGTTDRRTPGFWNGLLSSVAGDVNPAAPTDYSNATPLEYAANATGTALGYFPGKLGDAGQTVGAPVSKAWEWLNTPMGGANNSAHVNKQRR
jgi:hypothetical protein